MLLADRPQSMFREALAHAAIPVVYSVPTEQTSPNFCDAFALGCGGRVNPTQTLEARRPVALFGSPALWPLLTDARAAGRTWFYGDHGYFGRKHYYRVTRNAFQHLGIPNATGVDGTRFARFGRPIQPWRQGGRHILVCPNSATWFRLFDIDVDNWILEIHEQLRRHTDRPIKVRWKQDALTRPIDVDLQDAWAVVAGTSAAAIDALIAGVPVFVLSELAAAHRMGTADLSRIEDPFYPDDRLPFCAELANHQWTLPEIARGDAWRDLTRVNP